MKIETPLQKNRRRRVSEFFLFAVLVCGFHSLARAGDVDAKLTTTDGSTKFTIQDSAAVEVASVTSDGDAYFDSITQTGNGGNMILNRNSLQVGATFYVSSGTVAGQLMVGNILNVGGPGSLSDNYLAIPMISGAAIAAKQAVVLNITGQVVTTTIASSITVVGVSVTSTSGANQAIWVATAGIVSSVPCSAIMTPGMRVCTGTTAGDIAGCASATNDGTGLGKMLSSCTAATTGSVLLLSH